MTSQDTMSLAAQAQARLAELYREYEVGQRRLTELLAQESAVRETLLRIAGAIQVLTELTGESAAELSPDGAHPDGIQAGDVRPDDVRPDPGAGATGTRLRVG